MIRKFLFTIFFFFLAAIGFCVSNTTTTSFKYVIDLSAEEYATPTFHSSMEESSPLLTAVNITPEDSTSPFFMHLVTNMNPHSVKFSLSPFVNSENETVDIPYQLQAKRIVRIVNDSETTTSETTTKVGQLSSTSPQIVFDPYSFDSGALSIEYWFQLNYQFLKDDGTTTTSSLFFPEGRYTATLTVDVTSP